jgi:hypothetical protein
MPQTDDAPSASGTSWVYVIELDSKVVGTRVKWDSRNPSYVPGRPCVYVGSTSRTPEERFEQHKRGFKAARIVKKYGVRVMQRACRRVPSDEAERREVARAARLRKRGWWVWQN